jgi:hypothetical protein
MVIDSRQDHCRVHLPELRECDISAERHVAVVLAAFIRRNGLERIRHVLHLRWRGGGGGGGAPGGPGGRGAGVRWMVGARGHAERDGDGAASIDRAGYLGVIRGNAESDKSIRDRELLDHIHLHRRVQLQDAPDCQSNTRM